MLLLANKQKLGPIFSNAKEIYHVVYDFAVDAGAIEDYEVLEAGGPVLVKLAAAYVETALTSAGAMVVDLGKGAGGTEFWSDKAVAALSLNSAHKADAETPVYLASGDKIVMGIEAFAATAGKLHLVFEAYKAK